MERDPTNYLVISEYVCMCTEKVKGPSRREAKLLKWLRRNRKLCFHSCSQVHERFLCPQVEETPWWRRQYEASCEEEDGGLHLVHTLTLSLNNRGFSLLSLIPSGPENASPSQAVRAQLCLLAPFPSQPRRVRRLNYSPSLGNSQTKTSLGPLRTHSHQQHPSATQQGVMVKPSGNRTPTRKQVIMFLSERLQRVTCRRNIILHYTCYKVPTILL